MMKTYTILKARIYAKTYFFLTENKKINYKDYKDSKFKKMCNCLFSSYIF